MEPNTTDRLAMLEEKIDAIYTSVEKTRKYFQITMWITIAFVVLPLLGLVFAIPAMLSSYSAALTL